jgi:tRNA(Ile)-lysidine synthase
MKKRFSENLRQFPLRGTLVVACSGGSDSMAMLVLLGESQHLHQQEILVAHVNHNVRPAAQTQRDLAVIEKVCQHYSFPLHVEVLPADAFAQSSSFEADARNARYAFLNRLAEQHNRALIATAHTLDDQAETIYMRFIDGCGFSGLKGIPQRNGAVIRPLLGFKKSELQAYLTEQDVEWSEDSTNNTPLYRRNRLRSYLKQLETGDRNIQKALASLSRHAAEVDEFLNYFNSEADKITVYTGHQVSFPLEKFIGYPQLLKKQLLYHLYDRLMHGEVEKAFRLPERFFKNLNYQKEYPVIARGHGIVLYKKAGRLIMKKTFNVN